MVERLSQFHTMKINLIVAMALNRGIGINGKIPWHLKKDMSIFAELTKSTSDSSKKNAVIMGRKTWESIPEKNRPLVGRFNVILSRQASLLNTNCQNVFVKPSLEDALLFLDSPNISDQIETVWVIGGASVYEDAMKHPNCYRLYVTQVMKDFECDVFMPEIDTTKFKLVSDPRLPQDDVEENGIRFKFDVFEKKD